MTEKVQRRPRTDTKARLVEVAARHFAADGYEAASLREIQREAGVNSAAAHYHFGSKEALYREVLETYLDQILEERMRLLIAIEPGLDRQAHLAALVRAYVSPHLRTAATEHGAPYARMLARVVVEPTASLVFAEVVGRVRRRYLAALETLLPEAEPNALARALGFTVIVMASAPFDPTYRAVAGQDSISDGVETLIEAVTAFCVAGFLALCGGNIPPATTGRP